MVEKIMNNTTPYGKIRASYEGSLHSSTLSDILTVFFPSKGNVRHNCVISLNVLMIFIMNR